MTTLLSFLAILLVTALVNELLGWTPVLARRVVRRLVRRLPEPYRDRYLEEWLAEIDHISASGRPFSLLVWTLGICTSTRTTARNLRSVVILPTDPEELFEFIMSVHFVDDLVSFVRRHGNSKSRQQYAFILEVRARMLAKRGDPSAAAVFHERAVMLSILPPEALTSPTFKQLMEILEKSG